MGRVWLLWGCIFGGFHVILGAFCAHAFEKLLVADQLETLATANEYMAFHAMALLGLGLWNHWEKWSSSLFPGLCFVLGTVLFSGSLYIYVFFDLKWAVFVTPMGGTLFIIGWILFAVSILRTKNSII